MRLDHLLSKYDPSRSALSDFIVSLFKTRGQSGLDMRDVAVLVSLSSPDNNMCQVSLSRLLLERDRPCGHRAS